MFPFYSHPHLKIPSLLRNEEFEKSGFTPATTQYRTG